MATRAEKMARVQELEALLAASPSWLVSYYRGLSVPAIAELRRELAEVGAHFYVAKNTLVRIAAANQGLGDLSELFDGPIGITVCGADPSGAAKILAKYAVRNEAYALRGGRVDGEMIDLPLFQRLAAIPSLEQLTAEAVFGIAAPLTGLVYSLSGILSGLVTALDQIREQRAEA